MEPNGSPDWDKLLNFNPSPSNSQAGDSQARNADSSNDEDWWNAGLDDNDLRDPFSLGDIRLSGLPYVPNLPGIESTLATDPAENPDNRELGEYVDQIQSLDMGLGLNLDIDQDFAGHGQLNIDQGAENVEADYVVIDNYGGIQHLSAITSTQAFIGYYIPAVDGTSYPFFVS
jgi:hypothetical protein